MDPSSNVREFESWRKFFRDADVSGQLFARIETWLDCHWRYKHGLSVLARERLGKLAEAVEKGDIATAGSLLCSWGIR